jgi:hypothetical protein
MTSAGGREACPARRTLGPVHFESVHRKNVINIVKYVINIVNKNVIDREERSSAE